MKYIKYFETFEEYEAWMSEESNAESVYESEEKICVDGIILTHTYKSFEESIDEAITDDLWMVRSQ